MRELSKINHVFYVSELRPKPIDSDLLQLVSFLSKRVDVACLQRLPTEQISTMNSAYVNSLWAYYVDFDFITADAYQDYKSFNKLDLNSNLNLLIGNLIGESYSDALWLWDEHYTDQFNPPVVEKTEITQIIASKLNFLISGKFF